MKSKCSKKIKLFYLFFLVSFLLLPNKINSQCAGNNNTITVCDKELDVNLQNFNLFDQLLGSPQTGGVWTANDPLNNSALDTANNTVNLWTINRFGTHSFVYTNDTCNETATITINLGGYPGENNIGGGANTCSNDENVNLFTFLDNQLLGLNVDLNGTWTGVGSAENFLDENIFDAKNAGAGTYTFNYTIDAVDTCSSRTASVVLEVHEEQSSGEALNLDICATEDLSVYTNFDLFNLLTEEDLGGTWTDESGTNQITTPSDSTINIEEIYSNFGSGDYEFTYTISQNNAVCIDEEPERSTVIISISETTGEFKVTNGDCKENPLVIEVIYNNNTNKEEISFDLEYEITNAFNNNLVYTGTLNGVINGVINGEGTSPDDPSFVKTIVELNPNVITEAGKYKIKTSNISNISGILCTSLEILETEFIVYDTQVSIDQLCFNGNNAEIIISNLVDGNGEQSNNTYSISYTIEDSINGTSKLIENQEITFANGTAILPIDISSFPSNAIDYNLKINNPPNIGFTCIDFDFSAALIPEDIKLDIIIDNICNATDIKASIDAPQISPGIYTITYEISEDDSTDVLSENTITINGGNTDFDVDISALNTGDYKIVLKSVQNDTNPCRTEFEFEETSFFSINGSPSAPVFEANQSFCHTDFPNPKISDIEITSGDDLVWYEDNTSTAPIDASILLIDGEDYFAAFVDSGNVCTSEERTAVVITINKPSVLTSNNTTPSFCSQNNATIADLQAIINNANVLWYDAVSDGNLLDTNTNLEDGKSYFAVENINGCETDTRLEFIPNISSSTTPIYTGSNSLCVLDNLTLFDLEAEISTDNNSNIIWYDSLQDGNELNNSTELQENTNYYAVGRNTTTDCESERLLIPINVSECDPEKYAFYIPDGFSPNGDNLNDTYYIPNITVFYPDYEIEIFNRYGQFMFKGNKNNPAWDGKNLNSEKDATTGVYFYILNYNKNNQKSKQGRLYLSK